MGSTYNHMKDRQTLWLCVPTGDTWQLPWTGVQGREGIPGSDREGDPDFASQDLRLCGNVEKGGNGLGGRDNPGPSSSQGLARKPRGWQGFSLGHTALCPGIRAALFSFPPVSVSLVRREDPGPPAPATPPLVLLAHTSYHSVTDTAP